MTIIKKFEPEKEDKAASWHQKRIIISVILVLTLLIIPEIWISHSLATYGDKLKDIENLQSSLSLENQVLENEVSSLSAINKIASSSGALGLIAPKDIQYIR